MRERASEREREGGGGGFGNTGIPPISLPREEAKPSNVFRALTWKPRPGLAYVCPSLLDSGKRGCYFFCLQGPRPPRAEEPAHPTQNRLVRKHVFGRLKGRKAGGWEDGTPGRQLTGRKSLCASKRIPIRAAGAPENLMHHPGLLGGCLIQIGVLANAN